MTGYRPIIRTARFIAKPCPHLGGDHAILCAGGGRLLGDVHQMTHNGMFQLWDGVGYGRNYRTLTCAANALCVAQHV